MLLCRDLRRTHADARRTAKKRVETSLNPAGNSLRRISQVGCKTQ
jgi:hypothetical protein